MMKMRPIRTVTSACLALLLFGIPMAAQSFDTSGNATLKGDYFVRQVLVTNLDQVTSAVGRAISLIGTMTFDGNGSYKFSGQLMDTQAGSVKAYTVDNGFYALQSNGLLQLENPIDSDDTEFGAVGAVGPAAIVASSTEGPYDDIFVAIPVASGASNATIQGSYRAGFIDFLGGSASQVRDGYFDLTSNGAGSFGNVTVTGAMANQGSANTNQNLANVAYSISANGSGTLTFPAFPNPSSVLVTGQKILYVSKDGNILLGGSASGFDMIVAIRAASGVTNDSYQGTYFIAALENDAIDLANGNNFIDSFSGSTLALGQGTTISTLRFVSFNQNAYDYTLDGVNSFDSTGTDQSDLFESMLGANGQAVIAVGRSDFYSLTVGFHAMNYPATQVFIDPTKVFNGASFAPITNSVAPGEYMSLFGSNLSSVTMTAETFPITKNLGGVQVKVNGLLCPVGFVSSSQINFIVPFGISDPYATVQVINNGVASNTVTLYTNHTAPGVISLNSNGGSFPSGVGPAAVRHADFSVVTPDNPAKPGETLLLYVVGLGLVDTPLDDGAPAPTDKLVNANAAVGVEILDQNGSYHTAKVDFKGLAPGFAGLYQINFVVPSDVPSGFQWVNVGTPEAYTSEAKLYVKASNAAAAPGPAPRSRANRLRPRRLSRH